MAKLISTRNAKAWNNFADHRKLFDELYDQSAKLPDGEIEGALIKFPVADGYAWYRVVKEKPLTVEHIPYMDGYHVPEMMIRGMRLADVKERIHSQRAWKKLMDC